MAALTSAPIHVDDAALVDLRDRLARTRWPEREAVDDWSQGIPLAYVQDLCAHWADGYDWRRVEAELNGFEQLRFTADVGAPDTLGVQVLHAPSPQTGALPLVLTHGWPGSVVEFLDVIDALRDPTAHGGNAADAFHVVCPTMPGYGFSDKPRVVRRPGGRLGLGGDAGHRRAARRPLRGHPPQHGLGPAGWRR
jgi:hypothetical protein